MVDRCGDSGPRKAYFFVGVVPTTTETLVVRFTGRVGLDATGKLRGRPASTPKAVRDGAPDGDPETTRVDGDFVEPRGIRGRVAPLSLLGGKGVHDDGEISLIAISALVSRIKDDLG